MPNIPRPRKAHRLLKEVVPFTPRPREPGQKPRPKKSTRELCQSRLWHDSSIPYHDLDYMNKHPEDVEWLKNNVEPKFFERFQAQLDKYHNSEPPIPIIIPC
jgi:hypothetical protein